VAAVPIASQTKIKKEKLCTCLLRMTDTVTVYRMHPVVYLLVSGKLGSVNTTIDSNKTKWSILRHKIKRMFTK
jgi:hypothetical protein